MLKKRKHRIKRRNTEPSVNHPLVLATPSSGPQPTTVQEQQQQQQAHPAHSAQGGKEGGQQQQQQERPPNLADICDSPTHATAV